VDAHEQLSALHNSVVILLDLKMLKVFTVVSSSSSAKLWNIFWNMYEGRLIVRRLAAVRRCYAERGGGCYSKL